MSDYAIVKTSKLVLKGQKRKKQKKKDAESSSVATADDRERGAKVQDTASHGGWYAVDAFEHVTGSIALEVSAFSYVRALDNGLFIASAPHGPGEEPDPEEIITAIKISDTKIALKSGYNKYLSIDAQDRLVGRSDAIGTKEQFEPVFQDGKIAVSGFTGSFLCPDDDRDGLLVANKKTADTSCFIKIRSRVDPEQSKKDAKSKDIPAEEKGSVEESELNYVKKYQSFQAKKLRLDTEKASLKGAQRDGNLHEALLNRRSKMKSDKFCK